MTLDELNSTVANTTGLKKTEAARAVTAVLGGIRTALQQGQKVSISGFGVFEIVDRPEREGRNPKTGQSIKIAASKAIKFKPGKNLREMVNG